VFSLTKTLQTDSLSLTLFCTNQKITLMYTFRSYQCNYGSRHESEGIKEVLMYLHFRSELATLGQEIDQLWAPELRGASDSATFFAAKGKVLDILNVLFGEKSREFRVVKLTNSPATVVKVINYVIRRSDMNSPRNKVVNL